MVSHRIVPVKKLILWLVVCLVVIIPVFAFLEKASPGYCYLFFWKENVLRYLTPIFHRSEPFYYYIVVLGIGLLPWIILMFYNKFDLNLYKKDFLWLSGWAFVPVIFFSFSKSKLPHYILPVFPAIALLMSGVLRRFWILEELISKALNITFFAVFPVSYSNPSSVWK